jgi:DNA-binding SARP family transcriptional activator/serine/threonine protein kinase/WD40 repeat protein
MELRVLGPVEVVARGDLVPLGGPKQRTVLAVLVQAVGRRVGVDALIAAVYGDTPPDGARRTVQTYVSNLRHVLGEVIRGTGGGYVLEVAPSTIDADRFEAAYRAAVDELAREPDRAADRLRDALSSWRGHPYADVDAHGALDAEIARLQELRLLALERRLEADLALGRHRDLLGELEALTAEHPLRESLRGHQLVALYRSGRQGDALAAMERTRRVLAEELGVDPSPQLRLLERQILVQDPVLDAEDRPRVERRAVLVAELDAETWSAGRRAEALTQRDGLLSAAVGDAHAVVVGLRGSAAFVAFEDVTRAAQVATSLAALGPEPTLRVALDWGDVEVRDAEVSGPPVNRAARIVALAHPGQVLLSPDAHQALAAAGASGWSATSLGRHRVSGVDERLALHQLHGEGMRTSFPPLRADGLPPPVPRTTRASLPGYELRAVLGSGDLGVLYRAYQASVGREVVVRVIRRDLAADPAFIRRFEAEGQRIGRLTHPHLLPLLDHWRDPDGAYLVHPWLTGGDLRQRMARDRLGPRQAVEVLDQVGVALAYAHTHGVVHGRLYPGNVLFGETGNLYVADLGLAGICEGTVASPAHAYTAPELLGGSPPGVAADVYALGVLAAELLVGGPLPEDGALPLPPGQLGKLLGRATHPDPDRRPATVPLLLAELDAVMTGRSGPFRPLTATRNPFKGLAPFLEVDAGDFHGREALVDELVAVLAERRLVAVVGPSGIGKSSVVRAGLLPALQQGAVDGSERWLGAELAPGRHPFEELAGALRSVAVDAPTDLAQRLADHEDGLTRSVRQLLPTGSELLLVIDQFEELFARTTDDATRRRFLGVLAAATQDPDSRVRTVVTLRADRLGCPLRYASFAEVLRRGLVVVRAPSREELARAVRDPAAAVGVVVEDRLVERIVADAEGQPGALPLVQHVLAERFEAREADVLTLADYEESGGLRGAVGRKSEELYRDLSERQRAIARDVFLRLVSVDEEGEGTRRVRSTELERLGVDRSELELALRAFARHRLLTFDRDPVTRGPTVEVAHEALLGEWERLRGWIADARTDLLTRRRILAAAREWEDGGRDPSFALRGPRLEAAERWQGSSRLPLTHEEQAFLEVSRSVADREAARARRRRHGTLAVLATALAISVAFSLYAVAQRDLAEERARMTRARELTGDALLAADPQRGILLALEAVEAFRDAEGAPLPEAISALQTTLQAARAELVVGEGYEAVDFSPDGRLLATDTLAAPPEVRILDPSTGEELARFTGRGAVSDVSFSPDGSTLAVSYEDTDGRPAVETFAVGTWTRRASYDGPPGWYRSVRFTGDGGRHLVAVAMDVGATAWEVASEEVTARITPARGLDVLAGTPVVAVGAGTEEVHLVDVRDGVTTEVVPTPGIVADAVAVDADGRRIAVNSRSSRAIGVWDRDTGARLASLSSPSPLELGWTTDGRLVHTANDGTIRLVSLDTDRDELVLRGHVDGVTAIAFNPDGFGLASVSYADETRTWDITPEGARELRIGSVVDGQVWNLASSADGDTVGVVVNLPDLTQRIDVFDPRVGGHTTVVEGLARPGVHHGAVLADDLSAVAGLDLDHRGRVETLPSGEHRLTLPPCLSPRAVSSGAVRVVVDGRMLCTVVPQSQKVHDPPEGAVLRSAVLDGRTGAVVRDLGERPVNWAALGPPGTPGERYAAVSVGWETIELHDLEAGELVGSLDLAPELSTTIWFSDDGRHLAFGTQSGLVSVIDVTAVTAGSSLQDAVIWRFREPAGGLISHTRIADGKLATASVSGRVRVHELATRRLLADLSVEVLDPGSITFTADGSALLYEDGGHTIRRFELDPHRLVELARSRLRRDLTPEECDQYRVDRPPCDVSGSPEMSLPRLVIRWPIA